MAFESEGISYFEEGMRVHVRLSKLRGDSEERRLLRDHGCSIEEEAFVRVKNA